jgi:acetyltransferase-like isoleucine patch superfamily enzyme
MRSARLRVARFLWSGYYTLYLRLHPAVTLRGPLVVTGRMTWKIDPRGQLTIGRNIRINSGSAVNAFSGHRRTVVCVLPGGQLTLGDRVGLSSTTIVCARRIDLDADVMIGGGCEIFDSDFHPVVFEERVSQKSEAVKSAPVHIERGAWVGGKSVIAKGVTVGAKAVVAVGAVVVKSVPPNEIWGGNPARCISVIN